MLQDIAPRRFDIAYKPLTAGAGDTLLCFGTQDGTGGICVKPSADGQLAFPTVAEAKPQTEPRYLFSVDDTRFFTAEADTEGFDVVPVGSLRHSQPQWLAFAGVTGWRIKTWYDSTRFCGKCGGRLAHSKTERAMVCPACGNTIYPTISPSVIVAVTNGDKLLLTRYQQSHSAYRRYALCAGYIETGETAEDAVRRELMEEVGLRVKNIRYYKSQPWPFSGALLLGYFCEVDGSDEITRDDTELAEAVWVAREEMPDRSADVSMTSEMMEVFRNRKAF